MAAGNIIGYVESELRCMGELPFGAVDSLVLSQLSYIYLDRIVPSPGEDAAPVPMAALLKAELFPSMFHDVRDTDSNRRLVFALAASPRFRDIRLNWYVDHLDPEQEKQFSAVTFLLEDGTTYVAYRGTDATFVGWKEDFNMAYITPVPAQEESAAYLLDVARRVPRGCRLRLGGHSKGGNLAVYAAMNCGRALQDRILEVYDHDGPGFSSSILERQEFLRIRDRVQKTIPQSSIIGMLLQHQGDYTVVESNRFGIMQHDPFSWSVEEGGFRTVEKVTNGALHLHKALNQWLASLPDEKRKRFVDSLYQVVISTNAFTIYEFTEDWRKAAVAMLRAVKNADPETRRFMAQTINELVRLTLKVTRKPGRLLVSQPGPTNIGEET